MKKKEELLKWLEYWVCCLDDPQLERAKEQLDKILKGEKFEE